MNILITGGAGYVGSTLTRLLLENGDRVRVLDNLMHGGDSLLGVWSHPSFEFCHGDLRNQSDVASALVDIEAVVHLAAIVGDPACAKEPELARQVNLEGSRSLIRMSQDARVKRFVFASTCSNYGRMSDPNGLVDEESELQPISLYAETKVVVEHQLLSQPKSASFCPTALRSSTVYGVSPRMRFDLTVNEFTAEMLVNNKLVVFGEQFWRPYIHVRDFGRAILNILASPESKVSNEVFNVGSTDQNFQKQQLVEMIRPFAPEASIEYVHKDEDPRDYRVSFEKIKRELDFETTCTVNEGIREVVQVLQSGVIASFTDQKYRN